MLIVQGSFFILLNSLAHFKRPKPKLKSRQAKQLHSSRDSRVWQIKHRDCSNQHYSPRYLIKISCDLQRKTDLLQDPPSSFDAMVYDGAALGKKGNSLFGALDYTSGSVQPGLRLQVIPWPGRASN